LDGGEVAARVVEFARLRQALWVEDAAPGLERPAADTDTDHDAAIPYASSSAKADDPVVTAISARRDRASMPFSDYWLPAFAGHDNHVRLLARLIGAIERLGKALERELVRALRAASGSSLDGHVSALAHGVEQARLLG